MHTEEEWRAVPLRLGLRRDECPPYIYSCFQFDKSLFRICNYLKKKILATLVLRTVINTFYAVNG